MIICERCYRFIEELEEFCILLGIKFEYEYQGQTLNMTFSLGDEVIKNTLTIKEINLCNIDLAVSWIDKVIKDFNRLYQEQITNVQGKRLP